MSERWAYKVDDVTARVPTIMRSAQRPRRPDRDHELPGRPLEADRRSALHVLGHRDRQLVSVRGVPRTRDRAPLVRRTVNRDDPGGVTAVARGRLRAGGSPRRGVAALSLASWPGSRATVTTTGSSTTAPSVRCPHRARCPPSCRPTRGVQRPAIGCPQRSVGSTSRGSPTGRPSSRGKRPTRTSKPGRSPASSTTPKRSAGSPPTGCRTRSRSTTRTLTRRPRASGGCSTTRPVTRCSRS